MSLTQSRLICCLLLAMLTAPSAYGKNESTFAVGLGFFTGELSTSLAPKYSPHFQYESTNLSSKSFNMAHKFQFALLVGGTNLAGSGASYSGLAASYELGFRLNFGQKDIIPYLEAAPALGFFGLVTSGGPSTESSNQASVKYGYAVTTGFDRYTGGGRGSGGWGISAGYFYFLPSPSVFEFSAGKTSARGVRIDFRFHMGGS